MRLKKYEKDALALLSTEKIFEHIREQCNFGPRHLGSEGNDKCLKYLENLLSIFNARIHKPQFEIAIARVAEGELKILHPVKRDIKCMVNYRSIETPSEGIVSDQIVDVGQGTEENLQGMDVVGAVLLATEGGIHPVSKVRLASKMGAKACIWANHREGRLISTYGLPRFGSDIPVVSITKEDGDLLRNLLRKDKMKIQLKVKTDLKRDMGEHILGVIEGNQWPKESIVLCAHYETVPSTLGANDNATGVAIALEILRIVAAIGCSRTIIGFFTTGEEGGAIGLRSYIEESQHEEINGAKAAIVLDVLGEGDQLCFVSEGLWPDKTVKSSEHLNRLLTESATDLGYEMVPFVNQLGLADAEPFIEAGIPATWIEKRVSPFNHTSMDLPDRIEANSMKAAAEITLLTLLKLDRTKDMKNSRPNLRH